MPSAPIRPARPRSSERAAVPAIRAGVLAVAGLCWVVVLWLAGDGDMGTGTMGLGLAGFLLMWSAMAGAMMLPLSSGPVQRYAAGVQRRGGPPLGGAGAFVAGSLLVWTVLGVYAYLFLEVADWLAARSDTTAAVAVGVGTLLVAGAYQCTPGQRRCLAHARAVDRSARGVVGHLSAGLTHGAWCAGSCAAPMAGLVVVGTMSVPAMGLVAILLLAERLDPVPTRTARLLGGVLVAGAVAGALDPSLLGALHGAGAGAAPHAMPGMSMG